MERESRVRCELEAEGYVGRDCWFDSMKSEV